MCFYFSGQILLEAAVSFEIVYEKQEVSEYHINAIVVSSKHYKFWYFEMFFYLSKLGIITM